MDTELFERLAYRLHETELLIGDAGHLRDSFRYCRPCRARIEYLTPVIEDWIREEAAFRDH